MKENKNIRSFLKLEHIVFDKIEFQRFGFKTDHEVNFGLQSNITQHRETELYKITLNLTGIKKDEYRFEISLTGFFDFDSRESLKDDIKKKLITQNAVAILMPYLRSEVSLLTAQPETDCVVLPALNINNMF